MAKKKPKKQTPKQIQKAARIKYAVVKNYFGDTKEARKASKLSDKTFKKRYGLKIPKKAPKIRQYKPITYKKHKQEHTYYKTLVDERLKTIAIERAKIVRYVKDKKELKILLARLEREENRQIKNAMVRKKLPEDRQVIATKPSILRKDILNRKHYPDTAKGRKAMWGDWVSDKNMPEYVKQWIWRINIKNGYEEDAPYGWAVVYEAIRRNMHPLDVEGNIIKATDWGSGDFYSTVVKL